MNRLAEIQIKLRCEHMRRLGTRCDLDGGGWFDCYCAMVKAKEDDLKKTADGTWRLRCLKKQSDISHRTVSSLK